MTLCPCCSKNPFKECCEPFILEKKQPETPLELMRSRYTAYTRCNVLYIEKTQTGEASVGFSLKEAINWSKSALWQGLEIVAYEDPLKDPNYGWVEFIAKYKMKDEFCELHEKSFFKKEKGSWYYISGEMF